ncbi:MAG: CpaF family protein, partial [Anaerolineae bacterium]
VGVPRLALRPGGEGSRSGSHSGLGRGNPETGFGWGLEGPVALWAQEEEEEDCCMSDALVRQRLEEGRKTRAAGFLHQGDGRSGGATAESSLESPGDLEEKVRQQLYSRVDAQMLSRRSDPLIQARLRQMIGEIVEREKPEMSRLQRARLTERILNDAVGYGPIQELVDDPTVTEIMVNRWDRVYYERNGQIYLSEITFRDDDHVRNVIEKIVAPIGRRVDEASPMVDARLPDGSRVNAVIPPLALDGACLTIRKFGRGLTVEDLLSLGTFGERDVAFLEACVRGRLNILISGGTGSGKTTVLNVLSSFIPRGERIVTIEDSAELKLQQEHVVRLEARQPNLEGQGEVSVRALVRNALRMRPDRIVVGEVRGGEALDMLQAMNTGHEGSMTTLHANSPRDALSRLEVMVLMAGEDLPHRAIREQIASSVDLVVQVARLRDGSRKVVEIAEVAGVGNDGRVEVLPLFTFKVDESAGGDGRIRGRLVPGGRVPGFLGKMEWHGVKLDPALFGGAGP